MRALPTLILLVCPALAAPAAMEEAAALYHQTDYEGSLRILTVDSSHDAARLALIGKNYFMLGNYGKAVPAFERALALEPRSSEIELWLGRAYGRRAEAGSFFSAIPSASKARQHFEAAVALDPHNADARNDLFDFYLNAPGFLGGGLDKAEASARQIASERPAESHFELAQVTERRKQYAEAESHLRQALQLAPGEVGRILDLACFLARRGRTAESDALFAEANRLAPSDPRVTFTRAKTYVEQKRNSTEARALLNQYLAARLTPDNPPKSAAEQLLRRVATQ